MSVKLLADTVAAKTNRNIIITLCQKIADITKSPFLSTSTSASNL